jgi:hypothetical protein
VIWSRADANQAFRDNGELFKVELADAILRTTRSRSLQGAKFGRSHQQNQALPLHCYTLRENCAIVRACSSWSRL